MEFRLFTFVINSTFVVLLLPRIVEDENYVRPPLPVKREALYEDALQARYLFFKVGYVSQRAFKRSSVLSPMSRIVLMILWIDCCPVLMRCPCAVVFLMLCRRSLV